MRELILVRHGEAEHLTKGITGGWTDLPLTKRGIHQIKLTRKRLKELFGKRIEVIYASDLKRAKESAAIINEEFNIPLNIDPQFRELNQGVAKNMTYEEAKEIENPLSEPIRDWIPYPDAESWRMLQERVTLVMTQLEQNSEEVVLIVSHGNIMAAIIEWWIRYPEDIPIDFTCHPASITWLRISSWGHREIRKLNETAHLMVSGLDDAICDK